MSEIEDFERQAFSNMLAAGQLPRPKSEEDAKALRKAGVKVRGYDLLLQATLPNGWQVTQTGNRHGLLIDDKGRVRAELFYKGRPHDTKGHLQMRHRYTTFCGRPDNSDWCVWDYATQTVLFEDSSVSGDERYSRAKAWLNEHYPAGKTPRSTGTTKTAHHRGGGSGHGKVTRIPHSDMLHDFDRYSFEYRGYRPRYTC